MSDPRASLAAAAQRRAPALLRTARRQKDAELARLVAGAEAAVRAAGAEARASVAPLVAQFADAYAAELARVNADTKPGEPRKTVPLHWLLSSGWKRRLQHALAAAAQRAGQRSLAAISPARRQAARLGDADATALVREAVKPLLQQLRMRYAQISGDFTGGPDAGGALWNYVPTSAPSALAANVTDPARPLFDSWGNDASNSAALMLNVGLSNGTNPRQVAGDVSDVLDSSTQRGLTIARTEMLGAYRDAQLENYRANSDVVDQWMWCADKAGCCPMCLVMDGTLHPLDEDLDSHPCCACSPVPQTKSWDDILGPLGISAEGLDDTSIAANYQTGRDWIEGLPDYVQRLVLGPAKFGAWQSGDMTLDDLVGRTADGPYGRQYYEKSLREMGLNARDYLGADVQAEAMQTAQGATDLAVREGESGARAAGGAGGRDGLVTRLDRIPDGATVPDMQDWVRAQLPALERVDLMLLDAPTARLVANASVNLIQALPEVNSNIWRIAAEDTYTNAVAMVPRDGLSIILNTDKWTDLAGLAERSARYAADGWWVGQTPEEIIGHEIGHALQINYKIGNDIWQAAMERVAAAGGNPLVSTYAGDKIEESFAETFALLVYETPTEAQMPIAREMAQLLQDNGIDYQALRAAVGAPALNLGMS